MYFEENTYIIVLVLWILSTVCASTSFWNPFVHTQLSGTLSLLRLVTSIFSYTKILITLRHNQNQVHAQPHFSRATEPSHCPEHSSIQKGSVQCAVGAGYGQDILLEFFMIRSQFTTTLGWS